MEGRDGKSDDFLLLFMPFSLKGLHIKGLRCSAITVECGCLAVIRESACAVGLSANLLLLFLLTVGDVSTAAFSIGVHNFEYRAFLWFLIVDW